jgi:hypothetical protein
MAKYLTICLLWAGSSLFGGCTTVRNLKAMDKLTNCAAVFIPSVYTATYSSQIDFYKKHFSGLFVFKAMNDTTERVVFMTETGFKFFDFEYTPHGFAVKYIIPSLNKKIIIHTFSRDLGYLVAPPIENPAHEQEPGDNKIISKFPTRHTYTYYTTDKKCSLLQQIAVGNDHKKSLVIDLTGTRNNNPQTINIAHKNLKLTIFMKQIDN